MNELRARPVECRDDGVLYRSPDGTEWLKPYNDQPDDDLPCNTGGRPPGPKPGTVGARILLVLARHGPATVPMLAEYVGHKKRLLNDAAAHLYRGGFVQRALPEDYRLRAVRCRVAYAITAAGRRELDKLR